jgi:hypothetical protein
MSESCYLCYGLSAIVIHYDTTTSCFWLAVTAVNYCLDNWDSISVRDKALFESFIFLDVMLCSLLTVNRYFKGICCLHLHGQWIRKENLAWSMQSPNCHLDFYFANSFTLKMKATCFSDTLVNFQWTTGNYIPQDRTIQSHLCENLLTDYRELYPTRQNSS